MFVNSDKFSQISKILEHLNILVGKLALKNIFVGNIWVCLVLHLDVYQITSISEYQKELIVRLIELYEWRSPYLNTDLEEGQQIWYFLLPTIILFYITIYRYPYKLVKLLKKTLRNLFFIRFIVYVSLKKNSNKVWCLYSSVHKENMHFIEHIRSNL